MIRRRVLRARGIDSVLLNEILHVLRLDSLQNMIDRMKHHPGPNPLHLILSLSSTVLILKTLKVHILIRSEAF